MRKLEKLALGFFIYNAKAPNWLRYINVCRAIAPETVAIMNVNVVFV